MFKKLFLAVIAVMFLVSMAYADVTIKVNGTQIGRYEELNFPAGTTTSRTAGSAALNISPTASVIANFTSGTIGGVAVTTSTIDSSTIDATTPSTAKVTTLEATGAATLDTTLAVTGIQTSTGAIYANGGIDRSTAATLTIGGANANAVTITPATTITGAGVESSTWSVGGATTLSGTVATVGAQTATGAIYANGGIDRSTAAALAIGATNANAVTVTPPVTMKSTVQENDGGYGIYELRTRVTIANVNGGTTLLAAVTGRKIHIIDAECVAYGGAVTSSTATGFAIKGTQSASVVQLYTVAKAQATESTLNRFGTASTTLLADGAGLVACDAATAITIAAVGGTDLAGATGIDVTLIYGIE